MADISIVGVRLTVEGSEAAVAKIGAVDAAAKTMTGSLKDAGGAETTGGLSRLIVSVENVGSSMDLASGKTSGFHGVLKDLDGTLSSVSSSLMRFTAYGLGGAALGLAGLSIGVVGFGVKAAASFQQTKVSFDTMLGSIEKGDALFKSLQQFNFQTPFQLPDITHAAQTLLQYGFTGDNVMPVLKTLTNVASAAPAGQQTDDLMRSALALGQISSAGVVRGQDVNQLTQAGFPIIKLLAEASGQTPEALAKQLRGGGITLPASTLVNAISAGTGTTLSPYADAAQAQNRTLPGQWSNLVDTLRMDAATASQPLADVLTKNMPAITKSLNDVLTQITPQLNTFFTSLAQSAPGAIEKVGPALTGLLDGLQQHGPEIVGFLKDIGSLIPDLVRVGGDLLPIVDGMARGFHDLLSLPFGVGTGLVTGLLVGLLGYNALKGTVGVVKGMAEALDLLATAEGRKKMADMLSPGAIGPGGKILAGAGGALGLGIAGYDASQHGASVANVLGGAASGALTGAAIGSVIPGVGTAIGAGAGAVIGGAVPFIAGQTHHHVAIHVNAAGDPVAVTKAIDDYYRNVQLRQGVPATP